AAEISFYDARRETARAARGDAVGHRLGQLDHLDRPRPIGQAANKTALLERGDQPMNAGLRAQVERILHFIERRWNSGLLEALMDETQEFSLLACEHWRFPWLPGLRPKQIMNGHYSFHMCSATI